MDVYFHNTLSGKKEKFEPLDPNRVTMYVCGPTVYDFVHIGNGRPAVVFDVLTRLLSAIYPRVDYVRNITDIDDKINQPCAHERGEPFIGADRALHRGDARGRHRGAWRPGTPGYPQEPRADRASARDHNG